MGAWSNFVRWLSGSGEDIMQVEAETGSTLGNAEKALDMKLLTMLSAIGYLANGLAMCDWRTIVKGQEERGDEFFRLNNAPNQNQSKSTFCAKLVYKLCMENEALIVSPKRDQSLFVADGFTVEQRGTRQDLYTGITIDGDPETYSTTSSYVIHLKMNWVGLGPLLQAAADEYENMITIAYTGYSKQAGEKGTFKLGAVQSGNKEQQQAYMQQIRKRFESYFNNSSVVLPLYAGEEYSMNATAHRNTSEINDVINLTDEYAERVALALRVPAGLLKGNVENTEHAREDLIMYGIRPIAQQFEQEYNAKRIGRAQYKERTYLMIDPLPIQLASLTSAASYCEKMVSCYQASPDELRQARHEPLIGTPEARRYYMTLNNGAVADAVESDNKEQGGEENDKTVPTGNEASE